jgi:DNA-binding NarL/FixJ family response regulator
MIIPLNYNHLDNRINALASGTIVDIGIQAVIIVINKYHHTAAKIGHSPMNNTIRIMIVDDHPAMRLGLEAILARDAGMTVVAIAANGVEAVKLFHLHHPDVTLMDLRMPVMDGIAATEKLLREAPETRIIIFSCYEGDEFIYRGLRAGAKSYLLKDTLIENLVDVIHAVYRGDRRLSPEIAATLIDHVHQSELTLRELEVLGEMSKGKTNEEIASYLKIAPGTVKTHVNHLLSKLQVADRTQAVIVAISRGFVHL